MRLIPDPRERVHSLNPFLGIGDLNRGRRCERKIRVSYIVIREQRIVGDRVARVVFLWTRSEGYDRHDPGNDSRHWRGQYSGRGSFQCVVTFIARVMHVKVVALCDFL